MKPWAYYNEIDPAAAHALRAAIAEAIGKEPWAVRNRLAQHDICVLHTGGRLHRVVAVKISARAHDAFGAEAGRRGFDLCGLFAHMAEIAAADRLFDAILGDHRRCWRRTSTPATKSLPLRMSCAR